MLANIRCTHTTHTYQHIILKSDSKKSKDNHLTNASLEINVRQQILTKKWVSECVDICPQSRCRPHVRRDVDWKWSPVPLFPVSRYVRPCILFQLQTVLIRNPNQCSLRNIYDEDTKSDPSGLMFPETILSDEGSRH